jgi:aminoglycoside phosphotransferase (APT) family kinase protein
MSTHRDGRAGIDAALVQRLIATQFPQWSHLDVIPVPHDGWDNRTYRLGATMTVRLPTAAAYAPAIEKEHRWLPLLAPSLPVPIPEPLAIGAPGEGYPYAWSVRRWLDGETATAERIPDLPAFAAQVAAFIVALQQIDPTGGPPAGAHSFYRGADLRHYDDETQHALTTLDGRIDTTAAAIAWQHALAANWTGPPTWFHGDIAAGNLLVNDGELSAVIDFGTCGVGDPACDLVIAWTLFAGSSRARFRETVRQDTATWARARGWALWKALISCAAPDVDEATAQLNDQLIKDLIDDVGS